MPGANTTLASSLPPLKMNSVQPANLCHPQSSYELPLALDCMHSFMVTCWQPFIAKGSSTTTDSAFKSVLQTLQNQVTNATKRQKMSSWPETAGMVLNQFRLAKGRVNHLDWAMLDQSVHDAFSSPST